MASVVRPLPAIIAGLAVVVACAACGSRPAIDLADEVALLQARVTPLRGRRYAVVPLARQGLAARATWEVDTEMTWPDYAAWLATQLPGYLPESATTARARFTRRLPGDTLTLSVEPVAHEGRLRVRVQFEALPS